jgi:hypothetical protein
MSCMRWQTLPAPVAAAGLALVAAGTFLPWLRSGARLRSSYELAGVVDRVLVDGAGPAVTAWNAWPVGAAAVLALVVLGMRRAALFATIPVAALACVYAGAVALRAPGAQAGATLTATAALATIALAVAGLTLSRSQT